MLPSTAQSLPPVVTARSHPRVLHVTGELAPFVSDASSGSDVGLAVTGMVRSLSREGFMPMVVAPLPDKADVKQLALARRIVPLDVPLGSQRERLTVHEGVLPGSTVPVFLLSHPALMGKDGAHPARGYALLCRGALELAHRLDRWPRIVHAHDWQGGMALLYSKIGVIHERPVPRTVMTVHHTDEKGLMPKSVVEDLGLGWDVWGVEGVEFFEQFSYLKAGASYADRITTVSARYARDIQTEEFGGGLHGYFQVRSERLVGIPNGIDDERWDPGSDPFVPGHSGDGTIARKALAKAAVQREAGLPPRKRTMLALWTAPYVSEQGVDLIAEAAESLGRLDAQILFVGSGKVPASLEELARKHPTRIAVKTPDEELLHRAVAGADVHLVLAALEPGGISQLYAMRYGTVPVVHGAGGLDEAIVDFDGPSATGNGFKLSSYTGDGLVHTLKRALAVYQDVTLWHELVRQAEGTDVSWEVAARRYGELYGTLLEAK